jgi:hypothetical protein
VDKPPETNANGKNDLRTIKSRSGHLVRLDDSDGNARIEIIDNSGNNKIVISTADKTIQIAADSDITIQSSTGKLKLSGVGVEITSQAGVKVQATANMDLEAGAQNNIKGAMVNIN